MSESPCQLTRKGIVSDEKGGKSACLLPEWSLTIQRFLPENEKQRPKPMIYKVLDAC